MPAKHISLSQSILGLAGILLSFLLKKARFIDDVWVEYQSINNSVKFPANHTYDNFLLAIDYLFLIGVIRADGKGKISLCD